MVSPDVGGTSGIGFPSFTPIGIARQPGFRKGDEFGAVACSLVNLLTGTVHALFSIQVNGWRLHHRHFDTAATTENLVCRFHVPPMPKYSRAFLKCFFNRRQPPAAPP